MSAPAAAAAPSPALVAVHAHPDDEAISTGGLIVDAVERGWEATVVTCTGGERGEIAEGQAEARGRLAQVRRDELAASLALLGAQPPVWLGYRDSGMRGDPGNDDPASLWRAPFDEAVGRLVAVLRARRPALVVTYDAYGLYGHPDHLQAHRITLCAAEAAAQPLLYPEAGPAWRVAALDLATIARSAIAAGNAVFAEHGIASPFGEETDPERLAVGTPDADIDLTVDVRGHLATKRAALAAHRTQVAADSLFLNVPDEIAEAVFGTEWFVRARGTVTDARDPLAGLAALVGQR